MPDSFEQEWVFVEESGATDMHRDDVSWDSEYADVSINGDHETNFVAVLLGDVLAPGLVHMTPQLCQCLLWLSFLNPLKISSQ